MFVRFWLIWALVGLAVTIWLFRWALRTGQFSDSKRSALLPLSDLQPPASVAQSGRFHLAILVGIAVCGVLMTCAVVVIALMHG